MEHKKLHLITRISTKEETDHEATGNQVREYRKQLGLSGRQLAGAIGWSAMYLCDLERGKRHWTAQKLNSVQSAIRKAK